MHEPTGEGNNYGTNLQNWREKEKKMKENKTKKNEGGEKKDGVEALLLIPYVADLSLVKLLTSFPKRNRVQ